MPKLSDRQVVLLAAAAGRPDGSVLPTPVTLRLRDATLDRTLKALLGSGIFRLDHAGKIVEHWDVLQVLPEHSANPNGMF